MNYCANILRRLQGAATEEDGRCQSVGLYSNMPLDPEWREIRLLEIHAGDFDAGLECTLFKSLLEDNSKVYQALSYHWGDSTCRCSVTINGYTLSITTNLYIALRHLRHQELNRVIWCDAVCINQADVEERSQQVQQMTAIYSSASQSDAAIYVLSCIMSDDDDVSIEYHRRGFRALIDLFRRPWWSRMWIVQEVVVDPIEPLLCCGHRSLPFTAVIRFLDLMRELREDMTEDINDPDMFQELWKAASGAVTPLLACRNSYWENSLRSMRWLLFMTTKFQCTDDRDKIYAILGLIKQHEEPRILANYSMPVGRLFREVIKHIIITKDSLDVLSFHGLHRRSDFPSWAPDFAALSKNPAEVMSLPFFLVTEADNRSRASGDRRPNVDISQDMKTLTAEGFCFDIIEEVTDLKLQNVAVEAPEDEVFTGFTELASSMRSLKSRAEEIRRKMARGDPRRFLSEPGFEFTPNLFQNVSYALSGLTKPDLERRWKAFLSEERIPAEFESENNPQLHWFAYVWPVLRIFSAWLQKRRVFITSTGSIGLGPLGIRRGDAVVVLFGASIPFILRRKRGHHILLGDCAVSGIMEGEMTCIFEHELDAGDGLPSRFFTLR